MSEPNTRAPDENEGMALYWPDHFAPLTWHRCVKDGCQARVDPWDHNIRCADHRPAPDDDVRIIRHVELADR